MAVDRLMRVTFIAIPIMTLLALWAAYPSIGVEDVNFLVSIRVVGNNVSQNRITHSIGPKDNFITTVKSASRHGRIIATVANCRAQRMLSSWLYNVRKSITTTNDDSASTGIFIGTQGDRLSSWCQSNNVDCSDVVQICPWLSTKRSTGHKLTLSVMHCKPIMMNRILQSGLNCFLILIFSYYYDNQLTNTGIALILLDTDVIALRNPWQHFLSLNANLAMMCGERPTVEPCFKVWPNTGVVAMMPHVAVMKYTQKWADELIWWNKELEGKEMTQRPHLSGRVSLRIWQLGKRIKGFGLKNKGKREHISREIITGFDSGKMTLGILIQSLLVVCKDHINRNDANGSYEIVCHGGKSLIGKIRKADWEQRDKIPIPDYVQTISSIRDDGFAPYHTTDQEIARELLHFPKHTPREINFNCIGPPNWVFPRHISSDVTTTLASAHLIHVTGTFRKQALAQGNMVDKFKTMELLGVVPQSAQREQNCELN